MTSAANSNSNHIDVFLPGVRSDNVNDIFASPTGSTKSKVTPVASPCVALSTLIL